MPKFTLHSGDCLDKMRYMIDNGVKVHSVVTDPPYHLASIVSRFGKENSAPTVDTGVFRRSSKGFMGKEWDGGDIAFDKKTWELCNSLLLPGSHLLAFASTRSYHRMVCAIEDAGFEIRDQIGWLYGTGFPKSHNISKHIDKGLGKESIDAGQSPNWRESKRDREKFGSMEVRGENAGRILIPNSEEAKYWNGWGTALKPAWEPICVARKPIDKKSIAANVLEHDTGGININGCRIGEKFPSNVIRDDSDETLEALGPPARFFYSAKASKKDRVEGSTHPTVKPIALMRYLTRLVTPVGGTVLDPFAGTGTTLQAAYEEGFNSIGIEREDEYVNDIMKRMKGVTERGVLDV